MIDGIKKLIVLVLTISAGSVFGQYGSGIGGNGMSGGVGRTAFPQGIPGHEDNHVYIANEPPNGGVVQEDGKYKIELVIDMFLLQDQLSFFLYKNDFKEILNENITGSVIIIKKGETDAKQKLRARGDHRFAAQLRGTDSFNILAEFEIKGKKISGSFSFVGVDKDANTYYCTMHPDITNSDPGVCSRCGMDLTQVIH